jgi:hypothetical protein
MYTGLVRAVLISSQIFFSVAGLAAIPAKPTATPEASPITCLAEKWLKAEGAIRSGEAEGHRSLLDLRRTASVKLKTERLVIDWGDAYQSPASSGGYYQVEYRAEPPTLILSFSLTLNSKFENIHLQEKFKHSLYVKAARLEFDFTGQSQLLTLQLKKPVSARVAEYSGDETKKIPAKLLLDLIGTDQ